MDTTNLNAPVALVAGRATRSLAEKIAEAYGQPLEPVTVSEFSDGEFQPSFEQTIRGASVFLIQSTIAPADNLMELLMMADAARRASAGRIVAVMPYFGFARQDRKDKPRIPIGAKLVANLLVAAGIDRIITMDLHADQIQGFFDIPVDHMYASTAFVPYIRDLNIPNLCVVSPDAGGARRAASYAKFLNADLAIGYKQRAKANVIERLQIIGDVKGKNVVMVDDMIDTAGTITKAANMIKEEGAESVRVLCTHGIFSGKAYERISESAISEVLVTDTIPHKQSNKKITVVSVANIFAEAIRSVVNNESICQHFQFQARL